MERKPRSMSAPMVNPATTSLAQCAKRITRVSTRLAPAAQTTLRCAVRKLGRGGCQGADMKGMPRWKGVFPFAGQRHAVQITLDRQPVQAAFDRRRYKDTVALDAGLLAAAQAVEHYEISRYGTLKSWAGKLNMRDAVQLLDQTLSEERKTDEALSKLAVSLPSLLKRRDDSWWTGSPLPASRMEPENHGYRQLQTTLLLMRLPRSRYERVPPC